SLPGSLSSEILMVVALADQLAQVSIEVSSSRGKGVGMGDPLGVAFRLCRRRQLAMQKTMADPTSCTSGSSLRTTIETFFFNVYNAVYIN
ncbi:MAG: hypothetical protein ACI9ZF_003823, partial [Bradyrhizobium sp.]